MPYYRGDYYRGDYYRGDLGGFFKKAAGVIGGAVKGFVTGGPMGAVSGAVQSLTKKQGVAIASSPLPMPTPFVGPAIRVASKILPKVATGVGAIEIAQGIGGFFGPNGGRRRRTMNHLNPKALARATRRVEGFVKKARKAVSPLGYTVVRRGSARCAPKRKCR